MLNIFVSPIQGMRSHRTGFDNYLGNVQKSKRWGGPKIDEARKDFRNTMHAVSKAYLF